MNIKIVKVGFLHCNCYILEKQGKVLVIDPGDELNKIITMVGSGEVVGIIITHHHPDHDGASLDLAKKYNAKIYDRYNLIEGLNKIDTFKFEVIYTPGHKEDLITIYFKDEKIMFCGDFIFRDSIGRCDLDGSNVLNMKESIEKIKNYDDDIIIYPGHGIRTSLGYEKNNNVYFNNII